MFAALLHHNYYLVQYNTDVALKTICLKNIIKCIKVSSTCFMNDQHADGWVDSNIYIYESKAFLTWVQIIGVV